MYQEFVVLTLLLNFVKCANYDRYSSTDRYANQYTTISNLYNQYPYKTGYGNDIATFPKDPSRYPNYNTGYTTKSYYNTNSGSYGNNYYPSEYSTTRYGDLSAYEFPFMSNQRGFCINRSQNGIHLDNLMGMWYGVEYIQHLAGDSRVDYTQTCIVLHISEPAEEVRMVIVYIILSYELQFKCHGI